ncbi:MAG: hypothetical protein ACYS0D_12115 [Planctomycetota bacterium]|jgi:hypothetical protein
MTNPDADHAEGLALRPELEKILAALIEAGDEANAAVVRRCIELVRSNAPALAAQVWRANAESVRTALGAAGAG